MSNIATVLRKSKDSRVIWLAGMAAVLSVVDGVIAPFRNQLIGQFIDLLAQKSQHADITNLIKYSVLVACVTWIVGALRSVLWSLVAAYFTIDLRTAFFKAYLRQDQSWRDENSVGDLAVPLSGLARVQDMLAFRPSAVLKNMALFATGITLAFINGWQLALVVVLTFPIVGIVLNQMWHQCSLMDSRTHAATTLSAKHAHEALSGIKTIMAFNLQDSETSLYKTYLASIKKARELNAWIAGVGWGLYNFSMFACFAIAFGTGGWLVQQGYLTGGQVLNTFMQIAMGVTALGDIGSHYQAITESLTVIATLRSVIDRKTSILVSSGGIIPSAPIKGKIEFRDVTFSYPTRPGALVLDRFNMIIEPNENTGLLAKSGAGKSTLFALLLRLYDPDKGTILLDDIDIKTLDVSWLRQQFAYVGQETHLFPGSIQFNVSLGHQNSLNVPIDTVESALRKASAHDFVHSLPSGRDTVGPLLSGGQKQRIGVARAFVAERPFILLDEPTSALDSKSEALVSASLRDLCSGRTCLVISHRPALFEGCNKICVMSEGKAVEYDAPDILLRNRGAYYTLTRSHEQNGLESPKAVEDSLKEITASRPDIEPTRQSSDEERNSGNDTATPSVDWKRLWRTSVPHWPLIVSGLIAALVEGFQFPLEGLCIASVVNSYSLPEPFSETLKWTLRLLLLGVAVFFTVFIKQVGFGFASARMVFQLRAELFASLLYQDAAFYDKSNLSDLELRLLEDSKAVERVPGEYLADVIMVTINVISGILIAGWTSLTLTIALLVFAPICVFLGGWVQTKIVSNLEQSSRIQEEACVRFEMDSLAKARALVCLSAEWRMIKAHQELADKALAMTMQYRLNASLFGDALRDSLVTVIAAAVLVTMTMAAVNGVRLINELTGGGSLRNPARSFNRVFEVLDTIPSVVDSPGLEPLYESSENKNAITMQNVTFSYPTRPTCSSLVDFSIAIKKGMKIGIIGSSGSGFYEPLKGTICVFGQNIRTIPLSQLRRQIGFVEQEPFLFNRSIADNIRISRPTASQDVVVEAAKAANAHEFIQALPEGYDTLAGERGMALSGGQRQRVALARMFLHDPKIILLDEGTSALDKESEKIVIKSLDTVLFGRTTISVTHNSGNLVGYDDIVKIEHGMKQ